MEYINGISQVRILRERAGRETRSMFSPGLNKPLRSPVGEPTRAYTAGGHAHTGNVREQAFGSLLWYCHTMVAETATPAGLRITTATRLRLHSLRPSASVIPRGYRTVRKSKGPVRQYCRTGPKYVEVFCF